MPGAKADIEGAWVELQEEASPGRIVLKNADSDIPPARGRRILQLAPGNRAHAGNPGPSDRLESTPGKWELKAGRLEIQLPGWTGSYRIEKADKETLTLLTD
jgi:hypothetical protein